MDSIPAHILLLFLDGVGIGEDDPRVNPFAAAKLPHLRSLLGGSIPVRTATGPDGRITSERAILVAADATLGVAGLPQSGTGQTALLTGVNAAELFGRHFGSWVPTRLRPLLASDNLLSRAVRVGRRVAFANAYPVRLAGDGIGRRPAAPPLAADAAGALVRGPEALRKGEAVASSITNERWREHLGDSIPAVSAEEAGRSLGNLAGQADLTLFAHYDTDYVGHRGGLAAGTAALEKVDAFLGGLLGALPPASLLVIASDHGNLEDVTGGHTLNPVPIIAAGPGTTLVASQVRAITDVAPALCTLLGIPAS